MSDYDFTKPFFVDPVIDQGNSGDVPYQITISDRTVPLDQTVQPLTDNKVVLNDDAQYNNWSNGITNNIAYSDLHLTEDAIIHIGDDFKITGKEFKLMMKVLIKMAKDEFPEEFV